ncbi:M15 family metallopeptidase [Streptomyces sp. NPDC006923]|uniref:M15 family metallopeptidase n=1 Tax=Streptomyces sp. NPDC006923 TaxID=3155355 RepID=UPI0033F01539
MATSRRVFLRSAVGVAVAAGAGMEILTGTATADSRVPTRLPKPLPEPRKIIPSDNGWPVDTAPNSGGSVWTRPVPGASFDVDVSIGDVETVLVHVVRRFNYEIDTLRPGDVVGFRPFGKVKKGLEYQTNHSSGTAIDIRPDWYPVGVAGGFYPQELAVIRDILAECEGVVTWGGDFPTPDESHFQIDVPPSSDRLKLLAAKIRNWNSVPGLGAGVIQNTQDKTRLKAAEALKRLQTA